MLSELDWRQVVEARMRAHGIVMTPPSFDNNLRFATTAEPLQAQVFVAETTVETLVGAVLPRLAGIDQRHFDPGDFQPLEDCLAHEFRAVVRAQELRCAAFADQSGQHFDHPPRADATRHVDRQALAGELVDHREALQALAVGAVVEQEVVRPDVVRPRIWQWTRTRARYAPPWPSPRQLQSCQTPQPIGPVPAPGAPPP